MPTPFIYFINLLFRPSSFLFLSKSSRFHLKSSSSKIENGMEKCLPEEEEKFAKEERGHWSHWIRSGRREVRAHRGYFSIASCAPTVFLLEWVFAAKNTPRKRGPLSARSAIIPRVFCKQGMQLSSELNRRLFSL